MPRPRGRVWGLAVSAAAASAVACNAVLGMDAPTLAPACADGCPDGSPDEGVGDDATRTPSDGSLEVSTMDSSSLAEVGADGGSLPTDAAPEAASCSTQPGVGIRCGGGDFPTCWCNGAAPTCCQSGTGAAVSFTCVANATACSGYVIECADYNDCSGSEVCCRFMAHQICDVAANCPNDELVCDDAAPQTCPTGYRCDVPFIGDASAKSPYLGCGM